MIEFLQSYGFFILIAVLMLACHLGHGAHRGHGGDDETADRRRKGPAGGGHQH